MRALAIAPEYEMTPGSSSARADVRPIDPVPVLEGWASGTASAAGRPEPRPWGARLGVRLNQGDPPEAGLDAGPGTKVVLPPPRGLTRLSKQP
jgi:hypothetical protein